MAGEAKRKAEQDAAKELQHVTFDFAGPKLHILRADRAALAGQDPRDGGEPTTSPDLIEKRAIRALIVTLVNQAYPKGLTPGRDAERWEAWLEDLDDETPGQVEVSVARLEWLAKHLRNDQLAVGIGAVQWRRVVREYAVVAEGEARDA